MKEEKISDSWCTPQDLFNVLDKGGAYQGQVGITLPRC